MKREKKIEMAMLEDIREAIMELARAFDVVEVCGKNVSQPTQDDSQVRLRKDALKRLVNTLASRQNEPTDGEHFPIHGRERKSSPRQRGMRD